MGKTNALTPTCDELEEIFRNKYGASGPLDWGPRLRRRFSYYNPDDWYEAIIASLVTPDVRWLDVGGGRDIFPSNRSLASRLSTRCKLLVGADPDATILENSFVHEAHNVAIEDFEHKEQFDLITLRMVAEHIVDPQNAIAAIARCAAHGALIVVYTVNKYSPVPLATRFVPIDARHKIKRILWGTEEKDTFPTTFLLNSRSDILRHMTNNELCEVSFMRLDDCRSFARWRLTLFLELVFRTLLHSVKIPYPEHCILGVYQKPRRSTLSAQ